MASFSRVNPAVDGNAVVTGLRPLEYFEVDANANLVAATGPGAGMSYLLQVIESKSTIEILGQAGTLNLVGNGGNASSANGAVRFAVADVGTWGTPGSTAASNLQTAVRALGNVAGTNFANAVVYTFQF